MKRPDRIPELTFRGPPTLLKAEKIAKTIYKAYRKEPDEDCGRLLLEWIADTFYGILTQKKLPVFYWVWTELSNRKYTKKNPLVYGDIDVSTWAEKSGDKKIVVYIRHCSMADNNTLIFIMEDYSHLKAQDSVLNIEKLMMFRVVTAWPRQLGYPRKWGKEWRHRIRIPSYNTYKKSNYSLGYGDARDKGHVLIYQGINKRVESAMSAENLILYSLAVLPEIQEALKGIKGDKS